MVEKVNPRKDGHAKAQRHKVKLNMEENEIAREIVDAAYHVHKSLGPGLLESVYETVW